MIGTVKSFNRSQGYGIVTSDGNNREDALFVIADTKGDIHPGDRVTYQTWMQANGRSRAITIRREVP